MEQRQFFQCQQCGSIHYITGSYDLDGDMYEILWCKQCEEESSHLWIGNNPEDVHLYGDPYLNSSYFLY